jgi:hypothetical protein
MSRRFQNLQEVIHIGAIIVSSLLLVFSAINQRFHDQAVKIQSMINDRAKVATIGTPSESKNIWRHKYSLRQVKQRLPERHQHKQTKHPTHPSHKCCQHHNGTAVPID